MAGIYRKSQIIALSSNTQGALWKVFSCCCFASINGLVHALSAPGNTFFLPSTEIAFFQNLFGFFFMMPWLIRNKPQTSLYTRQFPLHMMRVATSVLGIVLWYTALAILPIAQAVALGFLGPLLTTIGARLALKETLGVTRWLAIILGLIGGFLISHTPSTFFNQLLDIDYLFLIPLSSALAFSASTLMAKKLTKQDSPQLIVTYLLCFTTPFLLLFSLWEPWIFPTGSGFIYLSALGLLATLAHLGMSKAFVCAEVTFLIPFGATRLIISAFIGFIFFQEIPGFLTWCGSLIIMLALFCLHSKEKIQT